MKSKTTPKNQKEFANQASNISRALVEVSNALLMRNQSADHKLTAQNSFLVLSGLVNFEDKEKLKKDWARVDWSKDPVTLAEIVVGSGNKDAISLAPLDWFNLKIPAMYEQPESLWLLNVFLPGASKAAHYFWPFGISAKDEEKFKETIKESFWSSVLSSKNTPANPVIETFSLGKTSLLAAAFLAGDTFLLDKLGWSKDISSQKEAEDVLAGILSNQNFSMMAKKDMLEVVQKCLGFYQDFEKPIKFSDFFYSQEEVSLSCVLGEFVAYSELNGTPVYKELQKGFFSWLSGLSASDVKKYAEKLSTRSDHAWIFDKKNTETFFKSIDPANWETLFKEFFLKDLKSKSIGLATGEKGAHDFDEEDMAKLHIFLSHMSSLKPLFGGDLAKELILFEYKDIKEKAKKENSAPKESKEHEVSDPPGFYDNDDDEEDIFSQKTSKKLHYLIQIEPVVGNLLASLFAPDVKPSVKEFLDLMARRPSEARDLALGVFCNNFEKEKITAPRPARKI